MTDSMNGSTDRPMEQSMERLEELHADQALWGLDPNEARELEQLLLEKGQQRDASWDEAAAAATVAMMDAPAGPSEELLDKLRRAAPSAPQPAPARRAWFSQFLAAAAITLAAILWWTRPADEPSVAVQRETMLRAKTASIWNWKKGASPLSGETSGDVVWDPQTRKGFMRFRNLPANDPARRQYQLWIFDKKRDEAHPVDGGVFDVPAGETEVIIPIDAKILVSDVAAFAVTVEQPGGVVVSKREHIVALAKPKTQ